MGNKAPKTIFTDQDAAMAAALPIAMPDTFHALCTWHIRENGKAPRNLGSLYSKVEYSLLYLMYDVEDESEFDRGWINLLSVIHVNGEGKGKKWLDKIHGKRKQWSSAWTLKQFTCGMRSTQLSESFNASVKGYLKSDDRFDEFFDHFERMVEAKREKEKVRDFEATQKISNNSFHYSSIMSTALDVYTPSIFKYFHKQFGEMLSYIVQECDSKQEGWSDTYQVYKLDNDSLRVDERIVSIEKEKALVHCSCCLFESFGILCRHSLKVIDILGSFGVDKFRTIPRHYILDRWTKKAKFGVDLPYLPSRLVADMNYAERYQQLCPVMVRLGSRCAINDDAYLLVVKQIESLGKQVDELLAAVGGEPIQPIGSSSDANPSNLTLKVKYNASTSRKRLKSQNEKIREQMRARDKRRGGQKQKNAVGATGHDEDVFLSL